MTKDQTKENEVFASSDEKKKSIIIPDETGNENGNPRPDGKIVHSQESEEEEDVE